MKIIELSLCAGRHEIISNKGEEINQSFFSDTDDFSPKDLPAWEKQAVERMGDLTSAYMAMSDVEQAQSEGYTCNKYTCKENIYLCIYVTGLTPLLTSLIKASYRFKGLQLVLCHYDRETGKYVSQTM